MSTLFVARQAPDPTRAWFPIGRLDASTVKRDYDFRYTHGALHAHEHAGFEPLIAFPEFDRRYEADELFPLFKNRVLEPNRKDFAEYLQWLDMDPAHADPRGINRNDAPLARRVLVELSGGVPSTFEPMTSDSYRVVSE